jgi:hypothetical protein
VVKKVKKTVYILKKMFYFIIRKLTKENMVLKLREIENGKKQLSKYFKNSEQLEKVLDFEIMCEPYSDYVAIEIKSLFAFINYGDSYVYKCIYALPEHNSSVKIDAKYFLTSADLFRWVDIRINKSKKIEELRKVINVVFEFIRLNLQVIKQKSNCFVCTVDEFLQKEVING